MAGSDREGNHGDQQWNIIGSKVLVDFRGLVDLGMFPSGTGVGQH